MKEPRLPNVYWNSLGKQLKLWRASKVTDAHALKLLKLWLGYEFTDLMDQFGRYPVHYLNEIRRRLAYSSILLMLDDIRRCRSFIIVGHDEKKITAIFSPLWHKWDDADGKILYGSMQIEESQTLNQTCDVSLKGPNVNSATASNDKALTPDGGRTQAVRRQVVREYFQWFERQTDLEHRTLMDDIKLRIRRPLDKKGVVIARYVLDDEQTEEVWHILIDRVLPRYFATREDFFTDNYMAHPERRIWWLKNLFKRWAGQHIMDAKNIWKRHRREIESTSAHEALEAQMQYRPRSQHEWEDAQGIRWYMTAKGTRQQIPSDAPPRPSATACFNYIRNTWN